MTPEDLFTEDAIDRLTEEGHDLSFVCDFMPNERAQNLTVYNWYGLHQMVHSNPKLHEILKLCWDVELCEKDDAGNATTAFGAFTWVWQMLGVGLSVRGQMHRLCI